MILRKYLIFLIIAAFTFISFLGFIQVNNYLKLKNKNLQVLALQFSHKFLNYFWTVGNYKSNHCDFFIFISNLETYKWNFLTLCIIIYILFNEVLATSKSQQCQYTAELRTLFSRLSPDSEQAAGLNSTNPKH